MFLSPDLVFAAGLAEAIRGIFVSATLVFSSNRTIGEVKMNVPSPILGWLNTLPTNKLPARNA